MVEDPPSGGGGPNHPLPLPLQAGGSPGLLELNFVPSPVLCARNLMFFIIFFCQLVGGKNL